MGSEMCIRDRIIVIVAVEEGLFSENHAREHTAEAPHVKGIVIHLEVEKKLWSFEISAGHPNIVFLRRMIEFG